MEYRFWKYQGTGNDFVFVDGRGDVSKLKDNKTLIAKICDRKFGIGADGFIILEEEIGSDFRMIYYNSDGSESTMCGNGGRCAIAFAKLTGFSGNKTVFEAIDGEHTGLINEDGWVELGMINVDEIDRLSDRVFVLNTGSPHYVYFAKEGEEVDIVAFGKKIRYSETYKEEGINVNVVRARDTFIAVETYERGVEDETLSCGTGVTACALAYNEFANQKNSGTVSIKTKGGELKVSFTRKDKGYDNITLIGPAKMVFKGKIEF